MFKTVVYLKQPLLAIARESKLKSAEICSLAIGCSQIEDPILDWNITLPNVPKPPVVPPSPPKVVLK